MFRTILKIFLTILFLIALTLGGIYAYLKLNPQKVIRIPNNPITEEIVKRSIPDLSSCKQETDCSWYEENIGKPPDSSEPDRIMTYCTNSTITKNCPLCQKRSISEIMIIENTQAPEDINPCSCISNKCTIIRPSEPSSNPEPST